MKTSELQLTENLPDDRVPSIAWLILGSSVVVKCAAYFSVPFLSLFLAQHTTLSLPGIGLVVGMLPLAALCGGFCGGYFADRFGRQRVLYTAMAGAGLCYVGFFVCANWFSNSVYAPWAFAALNLAAGWWSAFFWPTTQALLADVVPDCHKPRIYRYRYVAANIGGGVGPLLAVTWGLASQPLAFLATATVYGLCLALFKFSAFAMPNQTHNAHSKKSLRVSIAILRQDKTFRALLLSAILFGAGYAQIESNLAQFINRDFADGLRFFSLLLALNAVGVLVLQPFATWLERRLTATRAMVLGTLVFAAGGLVIGLLPEYQVAITCAVLLITLGEVMVIPSLSVRTDQIAPKAMRGTYFGAASLRQLGPAGGPFLGGLVLAQLGATALGLFMALLGALSIVFLVISEQGKSNNE